jgi:hypothetical protein
VYEKKSRKTVDLEQNIREEVAAVSPIMLQRVVLPELPELPETLVGTYRQGTPPHRHYIQEVNVVIKML